MNLRGRMLKFLDDTNRPLTFIERSAGVPYKSLVRLRKGESAGSTNFRVALGKFLELMGY